MIDMESEKFIYVVQRKYENESATSIAFNSLEDIALSSEWKNRKTWPIRIYRVCLEKEIDIVVVSKDL